ncbi:unnamed protein product [Rotaria sp. Silwood2]|nr:unnamed protein product [Rotaria sp. Silwood2]CAF3244204.1 unnamed protein product [Rotaria sp. Silwood2]CAF4283906.1 unnamed protein product [Rotaria sp. Silwood2]CAF4389854.1 unnamed protein product [Rotaria sp. Silwood2]CAF4412762.1 unnamed protein product [Rotaria sp. Silwood2]
MLKTIKINNLQPEKTSYRNDSPLPYDKIWLDKMNNGSDSKSSNNYKIQYTLTNGPASSYSQNAVLQAFLLAYNRHEDIILSPDDLWLLITIHFSKYVNSKSEQLRHIFVDHQDKKKLVVVEPVGKREEDWTDFFGKMQTEISKNVKSSEVIDNLINNFSTTTEIELTLSYACIMDTFKSYFQYVRCIPMCGIRNVHFIGTLSDWELLKQKAEQLMSYTVKNDEFYRYIEDLLPILNEFIKTYQEKVDIDFWNRIIDLKRGRLGSGSTEYITGWILKLFFGIHEKNSNKIEFSDIRLDSIRVPVEVENYATGLKKTCFVLGGFYGVDSTQDHIHKPVMGLAVIEDLTTVTSLSGEAKHE